jgi:N-acetylglutamate synthase-like GNAT family acetyltransferase/anti-sigma regulatory factor (Ser/Thr protein kinase)
MDLNIELQNHPSVIGPTADFAYKWGMNAGLSSDDARALSVAVTEVVTDVVRFAFPRQEATFTVTFRRDISTAEVIITEEGEPFDPSRYVYDADRARRDGVFDGAGFKVMKHFVDDFAFLNRGRQGKEFRLVQEIEATHVSELLRRDPQPGISDADEDDYDLQPITPEDAGDVAKLIYRTYGYTYAKEELYYPDKIRRALRQGDKFGVIARTPSGRAVGMFAVLCSTDSNIGEVGEAVVDADHRRRGLMTRMLEMLIEEARARGMSAVFGEAVTVHDISQRVNQHFQMESTALLLGFFPSQRFHGLVGDYPQPISVIIDLRPLDPYDVVRPYLPLPYAPLLTDIYSALGARVEPPDMEPATPEPGSEAVIDTRISYRFRHVVLVVEKAGADIAEQVRQTLKDVDGDVITMMVDLPINDPHTPFMAHQLRDAGFVFSGLMPRFHHGNDYLRMQHALVELDFDHIVCHSDLSYSIKSLVHEELSCTTREKELTSPSRSTAT